MEKFSISFCQGNRRHWVFTNVEETAQAIYDVYRHIDKYIEIYNNKAKNFVKHDETHKLKF